MTQDLESRFAEYLGNSFTAFPGYEHPRTGGQAHALDRLSAELRARAKPPKIKTKKQPVGQTADDIMRWAKSPQRAHPPLIMGKMDKIGLLVSEATGVPLVLLRSGRRHVKFVRARHMFFWLCREYTPLSYPAIGKWCGNRDHSTVHHGAEKVSHRLADYPELEKIKTLLGVGP